MSDFVMKVLALKPLFASNVQWARASALDANKTLSNKDHIAATITSKRLKRAQLGPIKGKKSYHVIRERRK